MMCDGEIERSVVVWEWTLVSDATITGVLPNVGCSPELGGVFPRARSRIPYIAAPSAFTLCVDMSIQGLLFFSLALPNMTAPYGSSGPGGFCLSLTNL